MGVRVVDALSLKPLIAAVSIQQIVGVIHIVSALAQYRAVIGLANPFCRCNHILGAGDLLAEQHFRLRNIRRDDSRLRNQLRFQRLNGLIADELCAACRNHNRIDNDIFELIGFNGIRDDLNESAGGNHADFYGIRPNVLNHIGQLLPQKVRSYLHDTCYAGGILCSQCGDGAHGIYAIGGHRFNVCLNSSASAGITSCDCQCCFHCELVSFHSH